MKGGTYRSDPHPPHSIAGLSGLRCCQVTTTATAMWRACRPCEIRGAFAFLGLRFQVHITAVELFPPGNQVKWLTLPESV